MSISKSLDKRQQQKTTVFRGFPLEARAVASRTSYAKVVYYHYIKQNFGKPTNLRDDAQDLTIESGVIDADIDSLQVSKSIQQASGTFEISVLPSRNWKAELSPGDWVMIYIYNEFQNNQEPLDTKNCVMIGNIDRVSRSLTRDEDEDKVTLRYRISGRNFGKVFEETDLWFDPYAEQVNTLDVALRNAGLEILGNPTDLVNNLLDVFLGEGGKTASGQTSNLKPWRIPARLASTVNAEVAAGEQLRSSLDATRNFSPELASAMGLSVSDSLTSSTQKRDTDLGDKFFDLLAKDIQSELPGFKAREMLTVDSNGSLWDMIKRNANELVNEVFLEEVRNADGTVRPTIVLKPRPIQTPFFESLFTIGEPPRTPPVEKDVTYRIKKGDTLSAIAKRNGTTVKEIVKLNPSITNPDLIYPNTTIIVKKEKEIPKQQKVEDAKLARLNDAYKSLQALAKENFVEVSQSEVKYEDLGKDDHSRMNLFWLRTPDTWEKNVSHMANQGQPKTISNPVFVRESIQRHGLKRLDQILDFCRVTGEGASGTTEVELWKAFMAQLYDMHFANHLYDAGTITCTGVLEAELGKALIIKAASPEGRDKVYFIEGYQHEWKLKDGWTTVFTITHGQWKTEGQDIFIDASPADFGYPDSLLTSSYVAQTEVPR